VRRRLRAGSRNAVRSARDIVSGSRLTESGRHGFAASDRPRTPLTFEILVTTRDQKTHRAGPIMPDLKRPASKLGYAQSMPFNFRSTPARVRIRHDQTADQFRCRRHEQSHSIGVAEAADNQGTRKLHGPPKRSRHRRRFGRPGGGARTSRPFVSGGARALTGPDVPGFYAISLF